MKICHIPFTWNCSENSTAVLKSAIFVWNIETMKTRQAWPFIRLLWIVCCIWPIIYLQNLQLLKLELCHLFNHIAGLLTQTLFQLSKTAIGCRWTDIFLLDGAYLIPPPPLWVDVEVLDILQVHQGASRFNGVELPPRHRTIARHARWIQGG